MAALYRCGPLTERDECHVRSSGQSRRLIGRIMERVARSSLTYDQHYQVQRPRRNLILTTEPLLYSKLTRGE